MIVHMNKLTPADERKAREHAKQTFTQLPTNVSRVREVARLKRLRDERDTKIREWQREMHYFDVLIRTIQRLGRQK